MADYTVSDITQQLRVHKVTVRRWLRDGKLKGYRLGGRKAGWRVTEIMLEAFKVKQNGGAAIPEKGFE